MDVQWEGFLPIEGAVLVIEDDPTLNALMVEIVSVVGGKAISFETADDALTYLLQSPDSCRLVIADHGVPGQIQGIEFIEMVASRWPSISAILTSGYQIDTGAIPACSIYLHKPWSLDDFVVAMATLLQPGIPIRKAKFRGG